jgi:hypothetical protein
MPLCTCLAWPSSSRDGVSNGLGVLGTLGTLAPLAKYAYGMRGTGMRPWTLVGCDRLGQAGTWAREASAKVMQRRRVVAVETAV